MSAVLDHHDHAHGDPHDHAPTGWRRWVFATNHKDIGTLYLMFSFTMLMLGGVLALEAGAALAGFAQVRPVPVERGGELVRRAPLRLAHRLLPRATRREVSGLSRGAA